MEEEFERAAKEATQLPSCSDLDKLILYGLFKQAKQGDVNTSRPGMFDQKGRYKWDAWKKNEGMSQETARQNYIMKVKQLKEG
ncbi:hypothetical protein CBR_g18879 [Chara braunii]|uniref:ACB domain-containing protein n=1 Tax=Chara braunii TaxID=69332 RepID=A0A388KWT3_CHABU|nr:hypothetical protein CBR_g18879 [Chara braunii]|eukprot:GBG74468.1 hypothetical protein CBR_g18879 [Chara braunii]